VLADLQLSTTDWIVGGFFIYIAILGAFRPLAFGQRVRVLLVALACIGAAALLAAEPPWPAARTARAWLPALFLLQGYWLSGLFFRRPMPDVERRLLAIDHRWFGSTLNRFAAGGPRLVQEYLELAYLLTFPLVPASFWVCWRAGDLRDVDSFWTATLLAGFACYATLPWIQTRPPRHMEPRGSSGDRRSLFRPINVAVLDRMSVQANTFPSAHAALAVAAALGVAEVDGPAGALVGIVAASVVVATVVGRYHYALDSLIGVLVGAAAWWVAW
jgi:membrane-associated phospholipid phosphatase